MDHYRNPAQQLLAYDVRSQVGDATLWDTVVPNTQDVIDNIDRRLRNMGRFNVDSVVLFLRAATADDAAQLDITVPDSEPSGLDMR